MLPFLRHIRQLTACLLLPALLCSMANAVLNRHAHRLPDGRVVWHAHPYTKKPGSSLPNHAHSASDWVAMESLSNPLFLIGAVCLFVFCLFFRYQDVAFSYLNLPSQAVTILLPALRGPPAAA